MTAAGRVLVVTASASSYERIRATVEAGAGDVRCTRSEETDAMSAALDGGPWGGVIVDRDAIGPDGATGLRRILSSDADVSVVFLTDALDVAVAADLLGAGAWDVVSGERRALLGPIVRRGLECAEARRARRIADAALVRHGDHLRAVVSGATMAIAMFDVDMNFVALSRPWIDAYRDGDGDVVGRNQYEVTPDLPEAWKTLGRRVLAGEILGSDADRWVRADGREYWLRWMAFPWLDDRGQTGGIVVCTEDITADRRAADELPVLRHRLARDLDAMKRLHAISTRFAGDADEPSLLRDALATAIDILGADAGTIRLLDIATGRLEAVAHQGLSADFPATVDALREGATPSGLAVATGERIVIEDVRSHALFDGSAQRALLHAKGVVGAQATPLIARSGRVVGAVVTYTGRPGRPADHDLQLLDVLARQIADMIERSRTIEALRESTERYRFLFDNMLDGVAHCRLVREGGVVTDWTFLAVNPAFARITRLPDAVGRRGRDLLPARELPELLARFATVVRTGNPMRFEQRIDAHGMWLSISVFRQAPDEFVAVFDDITVEKDATDRLAASEERLTLAKRAAGLGVFDYDIAADAIHWDERMREFWGVPQDEPATMDTFRAGVAPADRDAVDAALGRATNPAGDGQLRVEHRVVARDGALRHVVATGRTYFDGGRAVRLVGTVQDVSEIRRLEEEGRERRAEMQFLLMQQVAAQTGTAIAHELNQPLVAIAAYAEAALSMLLSGDANSDRLVRALKGSVEQAQRAGRTLRELLQSLTRRDFVAEPVDINGAIREAVAATIDEGYGGFRTVLELDPALAPVFINPTHLQKVLFNLMHNSAQAMQAAGVTGGEVAIRVRSAGDGTFAQVTIRDSGPGLDPDTARRVFEPFFTTKAKGIGLGLAISRSLVEMHGGQLWVDHAEGPGATFHFTVPFAAPPGAD